MAEKAEKLIPASRHRPTCHKEVQTEASFVPSMIDLQHTYDPLASEQYNHLIQLRKMIQRCMQEVTGTVYDTVHFKDIMFKLEESFPTDLPVTDMLLLSSKLYRHTCELGRLLSCFFAAVFSEQNADEHFHFMEIRILQKELKAMKQKLQETEDEQVRLQKMLNSVGQVALDHGKAVEMLDNHNQALQLQTSALEDQMALLFHQLNSDLRTHCKDAYEKVTSEMEFQERLNPTRNTFRQTMDSLSQQIRTSRTLISEVRETLIGCNQGPRTGEAYLAVEPSIRFKLKMLDSNFQQLVGRFNSVKDTVAETAHELMNALHERKKILYLSFQHIRLYDLQSSKLRHGKAILTELRNSTGDLLKKMQVTFPTGAITCIDRIGRITTQRWQGGYTLDALRRNKYYVGPGGAEAVKPPPLPNLTEVEIMAAESEMKAYTTASVPNTARSGTAGGNDDNASAAAAAAAAKELGSSAGELASDVVRPDTQGSTGTANNPNNASNVLPINSSTGGVETGTTPAPGTAPDGPDAKPQVKKKFLIPKGGILPPAEIFLDIPNNAIPFDSVHLLMDLIKSMDEHLDRLNKALTLDDEMSAFLRTLTLSVSSTVRLDGPENPMEENTSFEKYEYAIENALQPTGGQASYRQNKSVYSLLNKTGDHGEDGLSPPDVNTALPGGLNSAGGVENRVSKADQARSEALLLRQTQQLQKQQEQIARLNDDYAAKLGFLRQIYEARIADLEIKEASYRSKITLGEIGGNASLPSSGNGKRRGNPDPELTLVREMNLSSGKDDELERLHSKTDRDELYTGRSEWRRAKGSMMGTKSLREATANEIDKIESKTTEKRERKRTAARRTSMQRGSGSTTESRETRDTNSKI